MSEESLVANAPSGVQDLAVIVIAHDGERFDISDNITELSLFESIYQPYIHGNMVVIDNSMMLAGIPFVGQETAEIQWKRDDELVTRNFFINRVTNVVRQNDGTGAFEVTLNSVAQTRNAVNLFSQSYNGRSDRIIQEIFSDHLGLEAVLYDDTKGKTSHNIVFPYMKPLQAVDMIRKNVLADDNTPLFVYDTLYGDELRIDSFGRMIQREPLTELKAEKPVNNDNEGDATRNILKDRGKIYDDSISRAYNMFDGLNKGAFASEVTIIDPSTREYDVAQFNHLDHAPSFSQDWVSPDFQIEGLSPNERFGTINTYLPRNALAYDDGFPNINTIDDLDRSILNSYIRRHATTVVKVFMDSIAFTLENNEPFTVGQTVDYETVKFQPLLSENEEPNDLFNSGRYVISAIRHFIKNYEYTMSIELIRDGIGDTADFTRTDQA